MPLHRFGKGSRRRMSRFGKASYKEPARDHVEDIENNNAVVLRERTADARKKTNGIFPFADSLTNYYIDKNNGVIKTDAKHFASTIENESGRGLNMLAYYPVVSLLFESLLPNGVHAKQFFKHKLLDAPEAEAEAEEVDMEFGRRRRRRAAKFGASEPKNSLYDTVEPSEENDPDKMETPDKMNKLGGLIRLDERVMAQLSIATAMVVNEILSDVPSREIPDPNSRSFQSKRVIYYEDIIKHIHTNFGSIITLDPRTGDAFDRLSNDEVTSFARTLLEKFVEFDHANSVLCVDTVDADGTEMIDIENKPSGFANIYKKRLAVLGKVSAASVGKVWESKGTVGVGGDLVNFNEIFMATRAVILGNSNLAFGTKFRTKQPLTNVVSEKNNDILFDVVCSVMSLVAAHVMTYSLSYAIDTYTRLAIRGAERKDGVIKFKGNENVITPQIIFPGVQAALEMYGTSAKAWDKEVAFHLHTMPGLMSLFLAAHKAYDLDDSRPGVKTFSNKQANKPAWAVDREKQAEDQEYWSHIKGQVNADPYEGIGAADGDDDELLDNLEILARDSEQARVYGANRSAQASALADAYQNARMYGQQAGRLDNLVHDASGFGKKRRSKRHSFGKKRRSKRRHAASFGKKRRSKRHSAAFGKKRRSKRRSASFGKKTRKHKH